MVSKGKGRVLDVHLPVDHARLADCFDLFDHLLGRYIDPQRSISIDTINGRDAADSPYIEVLRNWFDMVIGTRTLTVYRNMDT